MFLTFLSNKSTYFVVVEAGTVQELSMYVCLFVISILISHISKLCTLTFPQNTDSQLNLDVATTVRANNCWT